MKNKVIMALLLVILSASAVEAATSEDRTRNLEIGQARIEAKLDTMTTLMIAVVASFAAIVAATVGFAVWDRRTMIRPFEVKVADIEGQIMRVTEDHQKLLKINLALHEFAATDKKFAAALRHAGLL